MSRKLFAFLAVGFLAANVSADEVPALKTQKEKVSYSIGVDVAKSFTKSGVDIDIDVFIKGLKDGFSGKKTLMTDDDMHATMTAFQSDLMKKQSQGKQTAAEENKKVGEAFLAENKKKEGVVALPSGLQYKILKAGNGKKPTAADTVECNYRGTLIDGTEFDSSYRRGQPTSFPVAGVIPGWTEALKLMPVGSKWQLFVPSQLAYKDQGAGAEIGPNATLIFEVELLGIK
ncbi:MAG: FKBP-type peptidyl-prolyl cis-trans isomerase [Thermoguttaceae bacterium]|jgi:FKBP-type peptidyl-prolyl cis-trans isomerase FklB